MNTLIGQLVYQTQKASPDQLAQITRQVAAAEFIEALLEVDKPLWGSFWQGDVIAPGYRLPAMELASLRAVRLDETWPEDTTPPQFLADLRRAIRHPRAGLWTLTAAGQPCLVFAAPQENPKSKFINQNSITVGWYCASTGRLHAGYRPSPAEFQRQMRGAVKQREFEADFPLKPTDRKKRGGWLVRAVKQDVLDEPRSLAAGLDLEILRIRAGAIGKNWGDAPHAPQPS